MKKSASIFLLSVAATAMSAGAAEPDLSKLPPASDKKGLTYERDIRPLLEASCLNCHGDRARGGLRLDSLDAVMEGGDDGKILLRGKSKTSPLVIAIAQIDEESAMPPKRRQGGPGGPGGFGPGMMLAPAMLKQADKNNDQKLTKEEFTALADAWFDKMDADKSGKVSQEQFVAKLGELLPPPERSGRRQRGEGGQRPAGGPDAAGAPEGGPGGGRGRGPGGPGGPGGFGPAMFVGPGLFTAADADKDGSLTRSELKAAFSKWYADADKDKSGSITEAQLRDGLNADLPRPSFGGPGGPGGPGRGPGGPGGDRPGGPGGGDRPGPGGPDGGPGRRIGGPGGGPGGPGGGPPAKPLTPEEVGLVRAWIDQGAK